MKIEYIVRSKIAGKSRLGRYEGLYPLKHIGIKVTDGTRKEVHHVQKKIKWPFSLISLTHCSEEEFSAGLGVKSIVSKEVDQEYVKKALHRMNRLSGKLYIFGILDCDRVAGIGYHGWFLGCLFHRQFWVWLSMYFLVSEVIRGYNLATEQWDPAHPILNYTVVISTTIFTILYILYFLFKLNNTTQYIDPPDSSSAVR